MKTAEEIKKGLAACGADECHGDHAGCSYTHEAFCIQHVCADALAYIQQLEAQVPRWISVEERLPEPLQYVLVINRYDDDSFEPLVAYNRAGQWFTGSYMGGDVTHWMPLPEAPKEDAQ